MIHSLRFRLLLLVAAVLAMSLGAVAFLLSRVVAVELYRKSPSATEASWLNALSVHLTVSRVRRGSWDEAHSILETAGRRMGRELLLVGPHGGFLAATSPAEGYATVHVDEGGRKLQILRRSAAGTNELRLIYPEQRGPRHTGRHLSRAPLRPPAPAALQAPSRPGPHGLRGGECSGHCWSPRWPPEEWGSSCLSRSAGASCVRLRP